MLVLGSIPGACCLRASVRVFRARNRPVRLSKYFSPKAMISRQVLMSVSSIMGALFQKKSWVDVFPLLLPSSLSPLTLNIFMDMPRGPGSVSDHRKTGSFA